MNKITGKIINYDSVMSGVIEFDKSITKVSKLNDANSQNYIIPGFVDLHCHGGGGFDTMQGKDAIKSMSEYLSLIHI